MNVFCAAIVMSIACALGFPAESAAQGLAQVDTTQARAESAEQTLSEAIAIYSQAMETTESHERRQLFERAYLLFQKASSRAEPNAALLTNEGNAALQAGYTGPAIVAFRRAVACDPSYRRAQANLAYARSTLPPWAMRDHARSLADALFFWNRTQPALVPLCAAAAFLLAASLLAGAIWRGNPLLRNLAIIPALMWLLLIGSRWSDRLTGAPTEAVVIVDQVIARSADSPTAPPRLSTPLPSGTELVVLESRGQWLYAELANKQAAWIPASSVAHIP